MQYYSIPRKNWRAARATTMSIHVIPQSSSIWDCEMSERANTHGDGNQEQQEDSVAFFGSF